MNWHTLIVNIFDNLSMVLGRTLEGLSQEDLNHQPAHDSNSIGWLVWHVLRGQDLGIAGLKGDEQLWIREGWHAKFNRPAETMDFGLGHTPEDLAAFKSPDVKTLLGYQKAVFEQTKRYLSNLSESDLDRKLEHPVFPTVGARITAIISDNLQHAGQAGYVRGLIQGKGWLPF
jgi:uncharacterized damage-inducible protein DinB